MPVPKPRSGEGKNKFISRCMEFLVGEGRDSNTAAGICYSQWRGKEDETEAWLKSDEGRAAIEEATLIKQASDALEIVEKGRQHRCRLVPPGKFQKESFKTYSRTSGNKEYQITAGKLKGSDSMTEQAFGYDSDIWTSESAEKHCNAHGGISFTKAPKGGKMQKIVERGTPESSVAGQYEEFPELPDDSPDRPKTREQELDDLFPITPAEDKQ